MESSVGALRTNRARERGRRRLEGSQRKGMGWMSHLEVGRFEKTDDRKPAVLNL